jgi:hypothetical protein
MRREQDACRPFCCLTDGIGCQQSTEVVEAKEANGKGIVNRYHRILETGKVLLLIEPSTPQWRQRIGNIVVVKESLALIMLLIEAFADITNGMENT